MGVTAHSTWKFNVPHSFGVHHAAVPDPYRGPYGRNDADAGKKYAADVKQLIDFATLGQTAAFIAESIQGVGGVVVFPDGYLKHVYEHVRAAGGVCIADEVQAGFGRTGSHYWGFESQGVIPDIVTMAKGIGNGCPLAAVVTTPQIASVLSKRIHFNTFGGNPVVSAMGKAVLEVIDKEKLQENALNLGNYILAGLEKLKAKHSLIGDVRGKGLMLGIELVKDRATKEPAKAECMEVFESAREMGLLVGKGGLHSSVIRFAPPMCINKADADFMLQVFDAAFSDLGLIPEVRELERHREFLCPHGCDHPLQVVPALARHADLLVLNLRGHFELRFADKAGDLFGDLGLEALFDLDHLPRVSQRRHVRLALLHVLEADIALGYFADDNLRQRLQLEGVLGGELDLVLFEHDLRFGAPEIKAVGQFLLGNVHRVLDFHRVHLADDIE